MKEGHQLVLKQQLKELASNLTHTPRSLLEYSLGMDPGRCHLHAFPLPCSRVSVSPRWGLLHTFGALLFVAVAQRMPLDSLTLVTKGACDPGLMTL